MNIKTNKIISNSAITLIALVITIIVLLILAGVTISTLMGDGLFTKAKQAKEEYIKSQYEEELNLVLGNMRTEAIIKNEEFHMPYVIKKLPEYLEADGKIDYDWDIEQVQEEPEGIYKDYIFYIDKDYVAHIEAKAGGIKPEIEVNSKTSGYVLEGDTVQIEVRATIAEGIVEIIGPEGITPMKNIDTPQEKVYVYEVGKNSDYTFTAKGDSGRRNRGSVSINNILQKPQIGVSNNWGEELTLEVKNDYPEDADLTYTYYLGTIIKESNEKICTIDNLAERTEYQAKVAIYYNGKTLESEEITVMTAKAIVAPTLLFEVDNEKTALKYPLLTESGIMTCYSVLREGDTVTLKILNNEADVINYYSLDKGKSWIKYNEEPVNIVFPGVENFLAKSVSKDGFESSPVSTKERLYYYDTNYQARAGDALGYGAYDGNMDSYACDLPYQVGNATRTGNEISRYVEIDESAVGKKINIIWAKVSGYITATLKITNREENQTFFEKKVTGGSLDTRNDSTVITKDMKWIRFQISGPYISHGRVFEIKIQ